MHNTPSSSILLDHPHLQYRHMYDPIALTKRTDILSCPSSSPVPGYRLSHVVKLFVHSPGWLRASLAGTSAANDSALVSGLALCYPEASLQREPWAGGRRRRLLWDMLPIPDAPGGIMAVVDMGREAKLVMAPTGMALWTCAAFAPRRPPRPREGSLQTGLVEPNIHSEGGVGHIEYLRVNDLTERKPQA
ncbi:hypothetical protein C1H76_8735 [Elsinoe australis]|uniref:Uncharacterized protein n=1 Tax=Elsinoe australis TaxID=40998 RepID=A0A4U7AVN8_9PEZI|nr:hypothetical protein C1H76_8735 [Elsinoe australis]